MKKMTKTTGIAALIGAVVVGLATIAGKAADEEVDNTFDSLDTNEPEDDVETDVIEPEEEAETEPEEV